MRSGVLRVGRHSILLVQKMLSPVQALYRNTINDRS